MHGTIGICHVQHSPCGLVTTTCWHMPGLWHSKPSSHLERWPTSAWLSFPWSAYSYSGSDWGTPWRGQAGWCVCIHLTTSAPHTSLVPLRQPPLPRGLHLDRCEQRTLGWCCSSWVWSQGAAVSSRQGRFEAACATGSCWGGGDDSPALCFPKQEWNVQVLVLVINDIVI